MFKDGTASWIRRLSALMLAIGLGAGLAACGGGEPEQGGTGAQGAREAKPSTLAIKLTQSGEDLRFSVPRSVPGGLVRINFANAAKGRHGAQLVRIDGQHSVDQELKAAQAWGEEGRPLPPWVHTAGGLGSVPADATASATQQLPAGKYFVVDIETDTFAPFEVRGTGAGKLSSAPATIKFAEYTFNAVGLKAGKNQVLVENIGREPHFMVAAPIKPGRTIADVREFAEKEKGEPPIVEQQTLDTAVMDGGMGQVVELDLQKGKYALLCFVPDRQGGPPHVAKGMISEAVVR